MAWQRPEKTGEGTELPGKALIGTAAERNGGEPRRKEQKRHCTVREGFDRNGNGRAHNGDELTRIGEARHEMATTRKTRMRSGMAAMADVTNRIDKALGRTDMNGGDKAANGRETMRMATELNRVAQIGRGVEPKR